MRLLNVETLQLEVFDGGPRVTFAILSHTWGEEEVSFQDMMTFSPNNIPEQAQPPPSRQPKPIPVETKKGFSKILNCCAKARSEGYQYVWIDTCCIDKSSSAELSEAINSMFKWYHEAEVCYALLGDVSLETVSQESASKMSEFDISEYGEGEQGRLSKALHKSRWFTRGWTLQELVAPLEVVFVDGSWEEIGTRETLAGVVEEITGIDGAVLRLERSLGEFSVAQRMSWAASRNTTRIEDEAYCLMGLFDVSMPLLYGEGRKAFKRLQLEIMRQTTDRSILAWASPDSHGVIEGVLASSPAMFEDCGGICWTPTASTGYAGNDRNLNHNACHDIVGFSLRMEAGVLEPPRTGQLVFREYGDFADEDGNMVAEPPGGRGDHPLADLVHFPRDVGELYTHAPAFREFDYGFLRHKNRTVVLVVLEGCTKGGGNTGNNNGPEYTVGITLCSDTDGLMKRVHFPSRFLIPDHINWAFIDSMRTLHASLSGSEVLQQPILPNFAKCMVRVPDMSELPYQLAYTIPPMADSTGVWYLERWGTIPDLASLDLQPCFSLHRTGTGRATAFHHKTDPSLSFVIIFTLVKEAPALYKLPKRATISSSTTAPSPISRQSTASINSLTSSISSLTSTFSRTFTSSSTKTDTTSPSISSPIKSLSPSAPTGRTQLKTQKQFFQVSFVSGPEALNLGFETDLAPHLPPPPAPGEIKQPIYSYEFDLPDRNYSLTVKIRKAPKVSNAGGKNYNALLGFEYRNTRAAAISKINATS
ncbi:heterokaryon incompatibility protein-domain-containing protein [Rhypophila decipiens]|uniref:Heterokaryon incompatibility protein-domain-containing protein n=1 Tax=Rhypophila decipiens TaxID=261697 RepID=A0AAN7B7U2_9PEZI|nr:heterokaryon incompatibility protein-domain-containing protein [Rhypophila decipiens]